jgi:hypothetical protein
VVSRGRAFAEKSLEFEDRREWRRNAAEFKSIFQELFLCGFDKVFSDVHCEYCTSALVSVTRLPKRLPLMLRLCEWLEQIPWIVSVTNSAVLISLVWLVHYFGFFLLVGITAVVDLRVLGVAARNQKLAPLAGQLFPWAWTGLGLVIASGFIMFAGQATTFYPTAVFQIKMGIVLLALAFGVIVQRKSPVWDRAPSMPAAAKWLALASLALWIGAILAGLEVPAFIPGI